MKKVSAVANEFLEKSDKISVLKLVKLCYIAQGFSLAVLDRPIFNDDRIEAWKYGPVAPLSITNSSTLGKIVLLENPNLSHSLMILVLLKKHLH